MRTSDAALKLDFTEPSVTAAKAVAETIAKNGSLQRDMLCGSWSKPMALRLQMVAGRWSLRDMLELVEVMYFAKAGLPADPGACVAALTELVANLPTHTVRSEEQIELQQFSTPAPIGYGRSYQSAFIAQHRSSRRPPNSVPASSHRFDASGHGRPLRRHLARPRRDVESRVSEGDRGLYADVAP